MKAVVYTEYGPPEVLHVAELPKPAPQPGEVLVRVHAAPVSFGDLLARDFEHVPPRDFTMPLPLYLPSRLVFGWNKPKINVLGSEFAGEVEAVGAGVTRFAPGDQVFGYRGQSMGAYAEYLCTAADGSIALKPANLSYAEAAALPYGALMASALLRRGGVGPGQKVLIVGASGGIGSAALQLARHSGAHVTGVCATPRVEYVRALGADKVIDYTREDFTRGGESYDLIFDVPGKSSFAACKGVLAPNGRYLPVSFKSKQLFQMAWTSLRGGKKVICALASEQPADLVTVKELAEAGRFKVIVDRIFPMAQAAAAHRYAASGQKQGHVIITLDGAQ